MCLILFGYRAVAGTPLVIAANRDEFHGRASAVADFWHDQPDILAGRDLQAGGTWLGCTLSGRFAALTNFSNPDEGARQRSRGLLVQNFLNDNCDARSYVDTLEGDAYAGFNLLVFDGEEMVYTSNRQSMSSGSCPVEVLSPGYYGLSNAELGAEWPKCVHGARGLKTLTQQDFNHDDLIDLLGDDSVPPDHQLPDRGRPIEMERRGAPRFIVGDEYGTRASTTLVMSHERVEFSEQSFAAGGAKSGRVYYQFDRN